MTIAVLQQRVRYALGRVKTYVAIAVGGGSAALASFLSEPANFTDGAPRLKRIAVAFGAGAAVALFHLWQTPPAVAPAVPPQAPPS